MADSPAHSDSAAWLRIALIWFGMGLFDASQTVFVMRAEGMHHAWVYLFVTLLLSWLPWALATPLVLRLGRRYPPTRLRPLTTWLAHLGTCAGIGLAAAAWTSGLEIWLNPWALSPPPQQFLHDWLYKFYNTSLGSLILYASILAISYVLESREKLSRQQAETARLNEQLSRAQLDALRRQIEPHFLFNTLNAIAGLVRENRNDAALNMIVKLSDFLRRVVQDSTHQEVPLEEEVEFLQKYLDIQKARFAERLRLSVDVPNELSAARVPSLILQPMVENAIKHGIAKRIQGGEIRVAACRSKGMLTLRIYNDGPGLPAGFDQNGSGTGIANVRTRLQSLYGDGFELTMKNQRPDGVEVSVSVPYRSG